MIENQRKRKNVNQQLDQRDYPKRYIYFIVDGQHALKSEQLLFSHIEVNERLCKLVP
jgi:hypothetical protein